MAGRELFAAANPKQRRTWTLAAIALALVFVFAGQTIGVVPLAITEWLPADLSDWRTLSYILYIAFGLTGALTLGWVICFERRTFVQIGLSRDALKRFGRGYAIGLILLASTVGVIWLTGSYSAEAPGMASGLLAPSNFFAVTVLLLGFIVQGSTEELVFRGWLMSLIASRHGLVLAVILNSLVFGIFHASNVAPSPELPLALINVALFGVFVSLYAAREGSIWGVCGLHASWNWLLGVGFGLEVSGGVVRITPVIVDLHATAGSAGWLTGGTFGPEGSVVVTVLLSVGNVALLMQRGSDKASHSEALPAA